MKKKFTYGAASAALMLLIAANTAFAQSLTTTDPGTITTPVVVRPDPADLTVPFTPEAPPVETEETAADPAETTLENAIPESNTSTAGTTRDSAETSATLNLPDPVLPVLDLGLEDSSDDESNGILIGTSSDENCITPENAEAKILPPVIGNQIKVALMAFLGAILGAILWILGAGLIGSARGRGELLRLQSLEREEMATKLTETLAETKAALTESLDGMIRQTGAKSVLDPDKFEQYSRAAADLEILGSEGSLQAHKQLTALLSQPNPPSAEEFETARSYLLESLQSDIMGDIGQTPS